MHADYFRSIQSRIIHEMSHEQKSKLRSDCLHQACARQRGLAGGGAVGLDPVMRKLCILKIVQCMSSTQLWLF